MNTSRVHLHVKLDFSGNQDSGDNRNELKTCLYSKTQDSGGFATNHRNSMRIIIWPFVTIWYPSIGVSII